MGNELMIGVLSAVLRVKDDLSPVLATVQANVGSFGSNLPAALAPASAAFTKVKDDWLGLGQSAKQVQTQWVDSVSMMGVALGSFAGGVVAEMARHIVGDMIAAVKSIGTFASEVTGMSLQTGIGVERLQAFNYAIAGSGISIQQVATGVGQLSRRLVEGNDSAVGALDRLKLSESDLIAMSPDKALIAIVEAVKQIPNPMEQSALMTELFGLNGAKYLRLVQENLVGLEEEAQRNGTVVSRELIDKAAQLDTWWERVTIRGKGLLANVLLPLSDIFNGHANSRYGLLGQLGVGDVDNLDALKKSMAAPDLSANMPKGLPTLTMSMQEADKVAKQLDATIKQHVLDEEQLAKVRDQLFGTDNIAKAKEMVTAIGGLAGVARLDDDAVKSLHKSLGDAMDAANRNGVSVPQSWEQIYLATEKSVGSVMDYVKMVGKIPEVYSAIPPPPKLLEATGASQLDHDRMLALIAANPPGVVLQQAQNSGLQIGTHMMAGLNDGLSQIGPTLISAFKRGGDGVKAVAAQLGQSFTQNLFGTDQFKSLITSNFGSALGGMVNSILPGIGAIMGPLLGKIGSMFGKIFGRDEESREVNPARDSFMAQFQQQFGGNRNDATIAAIEAAGLGGARAAALMQNLNSADTMQEFNAAKSAIEYGLHGSGTQSGTSGGADTGNVGVSPVNVYLTVQGNIYGANTDEYKQATTTAVLDALEKGGDQASRFRVIHDQLIPSLA